jgi:hypothetical protein
MHENPSCGLFETKTLVRRAPLPETLEPVRKGVL